MQRQNNKKVLNKKTKLENNKVILTETIETELTQQELTLQKQRLLQQEQQLIEQMKRYKAEYESNKLAISEIDEMLTQFSSVDENIEEVMAIPEQ